MLRSKLVSNLFFNYLSYEINFLIAIFNRDHFKQET